LLGDESGHHWISPISSAKQGSLQARHLTGWHDTRASYQDKTRRWPSLQWEEDLESFQEKMLVYALY
jgi:hypothetical protein